LRGRRESELDEVEMTDAFLLRSAKVGEKGWSDGECSGRSTDSIQEEVLSRLVQLRLKCGEAVVYVSPPLGELVFYKENN
jgi:hypothetical protein